MEHKKGEAFKVGGQARIKAELPVGYKLNIRPATSPVPESMKGPAFWSASSKQQRPKLSPQIRSLWEVQQDKVPGPPKFLGVENWRHMSVFVLVSAALALFCILMSYIGVYIKKADNLNILIPHLQTQEQRLKEAVRREARGKTLKCKLCEDKWVQRADACYLHTKETMSWKECIAECKKYKASLLIGKTEGEMEFLLSEIRKWFTIQHRRRVPGRFWIGLMYNASLKSWHWADGEYLHLRLSAIGKQPSPSADSCIMFSSGHVITKNCASTNSCLCKTVVK